MAGSLEEALLLSTSDEDTPIRERYKFEISNDLRTISIPPDLVFGVYYDRNVQTIDFEMPRYYHDLDLAPFGIKINYVANDEGHIYIVTDKTVGDSKITFTWTVDFPAYAKNGDSVIFSVCLRQVNSDSEVIKEFNTTVHTVKVLPGLEIEIDEADEQTVKDYLAQISNIISELYDNVQDYEAECEDDLTDHTDTLLGSLSTRGQEQIAAIQAKGVEVLASIPPEYIQMSEDIKAIKDEMPRIDAIYNSLPDERITGDGMVVTSDYAIEANAKHLIVDFPPVQDLHGYDHPWVGGAGKNLLDVSAVVGTEGGVTFAIASDGGVKITGSNNASIYRLAAQNVSVSSSTTYIANGLIGTGDIRGRIDLYDSNNTKTREVYVNTADVSFTTSATEIKYNFLIIVPSGKTGTVYPMVRTSGDSSFAPYSNICPIFQVGKKNLFEVPESRFPTIGKGVTFTRNSDGSISYSGNKESGEILYTVNTFGKDTNNQMLETGQILSGGINNNLGLAVTWLDENGAWIGVSTTGDSGSVTLAKPSNASIARISIRFASNVTGSISGTLYPMIRRKDNSDPTFEPYYEHGAAKVQRTGTNLCDWKVAPFNTDPLIVELKEGIYTLSSEEPMTGGNAYIQGTKPDGTYCTKQELGLENWYDSSLSGIYYYSFSAPYITFTVPTGGASIRFGRLNNDGTIPAMLNIGNAPLPYEPYRSSSAVIPFTSDVYGGIVNFDTGKCVVMKGNLILDGSETWNKSNVGNRIRFVCDTLPSLGATEATTFEAISNWLVGYTDATIYAQQDYSFILRYINGSNRIDIMFQGASTDMEFKAFLSSNPLHIVYELATPIELTLTPAQLALVRGVNTVTADGAIDLTYVKDIVKVLKDELSGS